VSAGPQPDAYDRTLERLFALDVRRGWDLKLDSVRAALGALGDPHERLTTLHLAGTNGKGSTAAMAAAILRAAGRRTGLYTSPHLVDFRERIQVDGERIAKSAVVDLTVEIESAAARARVELTFFELTTVMALVWFERTGVDVAVIEVGLGGRLDATNVIAPRASAITTIAFDHERFLGDTLAAIAGEKAGILKAGTPAVVGRVDAEAWAVIAARAAEVGAPLRRLGEGFYVDVGYGAFSYVGSRRVPGIRPALAGRHQLDNAATAIALLESGGFLDGLDDATIRRGLAEVSWPGRLERIPGRPEIVLDGAHNPQGVAVLVEALHALDDGRPVRLVFGALADKHWPEMVERLASIASEVRVAPVAERRTTDPDEVAAAFARRAPTTVASSITEALDGWLDDAEGREARIVVCGSLFVVGEARTRLLERGLLDEGGADGLV